MTAHSIGTLPQDVRFGVRQLRRNLAFAAIAIATLALGIGANTAIFSVVESVLLAPLPYSHPDRLMLVLLYNRRLQWTTDLSYPDFRDWRRTARSFQEMAAFRPKGFDWTSGGTPEHVAGEEVSAGFFGTLGVNLALGRDFLPEEDRHGGRRAVILSDRLWNERFSRSARVLGRMVTLSGGDYTIIGVLPPKFRFATKNADVYTPIEQDDSLLLEDRMVHDIACVARLKPNVSAAQAEAEMNAVQERIDELNPRTERGQGVSVLSLKHVVIGDVSGTLLLLLGAVGLVLLIASANVANLLLARSAARRREFAIRTALGANRMRIVQQLLTETTLLALAGGATGLALAKWGMQSVLAIVGSALPRNESVGMDGAVLWFTFAISIAVGILFGLAPAVQSAKPDLEFALREGGRSSTGRSRRTQQGLVVGQMALTLVLLVGAGLLFRTIRHLWEVNPGFDAQDIVTFKVGLSGEATNPPENTRVAYRQLIERIRQIPGVEAADVTALVPLSENDNSGPFWVRGPRPTSTAEMPRALFFWVGPNYLQTMGIPLLRGRFLTREDTTKSAPVIAIDSVLARSYFPHSDPIGQTMFIPHWGPVRVVGVVGHVRHWSLDGTERYSKNQIYAPFYQLGDESLPAFLGAVTVTVRRRPGAATILPAIKRVVYGTGMDQPVYEVRTMEELVSQSMSAQKFPMVLLGIFAGLALALAAVGIYGTIAYSVAQRAREIGVRMALGAAHRDIFRMVIGQGLRLAIPGLVIGAMAALVATRAIASFSHLLSGVGANDPLTFMVVSVVLLVVAVVACYVPGRRAMRTDPMIALRYE